MPPVGVKVSLNTEMQKFLPEKTVTPNPGQYPRVAADSAQVSAASVTWTNAEPDTLMERVLAPANLKCAYQRVVSNKGAPGADGMTVSDLAGYVKQYWPTLKTRLLAGEYHPQGVRAVEIPKPKGGTRQLGIPNVLDRLLCCNNSRQSSTLCSRTTATAFVQTEALTTPSKQLVPMWRRVTAGAWNLIWRSSLIESTTMS